MVDAPRVNFDPKVGVAQGWTWHASIVVPAQTELLSSNSTFHGDAQSSCIGKS